MPAWIDGPPTRPGLWIVQCNGDYYCWRVELDADENDQGGVGAPYLRFSDNETSEPLKDYSWPPERSYGPCPLSDGTIDIRSCRVPKALQFGLTLETPLHHLGAFTNLSQRAQKTLLQFAYAPSKSNPKRVSGRDATLQDVVHITRKDFEWLDGAGIVTANEILGFLIDIGAKRPEV